jgi:hypothetical protein
MTLSLLDWIIIAAYFIVSAAIGLALSNRGGRSVTDYFLSGRSLPWWLAGTSMVATTFAADTPLAVAGLVARNGIAGNWIWWSAAFGGMLTVFFFARLGRRAGVLTDVEFAELRYTGRPAAILRGFRALYLGLPINCVIMGWVNLAMAKILSVTLGWDQLTAVLISLAITGIYSALSGLWGVVVTDFVQFTFAMIGTTALAWFALQLPQIGGLSGLTAQLPAGTLDFVPSFGDDFATGATVVALPIATFLTYVTVQWWASWYPGQEPGGGGYIAQRMMSAKDERHSLFATLWFTIAHYCVRPWPWIIVGLVSMVLYPNITDKEAGYAMVMRDHLPNGWRVAGCVLCGVHVHHLQPAQLGNVVHRQRFLSPISGTRRYGEALRLDCTSDHDDAHDSERHRHLLSGQHSPSVGVRSRVGSGHRTGADPALVLVAHQRLVRDLGDDCGRRRLRCAEAVHGDGVSVHASDCNGVDNVLLDCRDLLNGTRAGRTSGRVLSTHATRRTRMEPHCGPGW